MARRRARIRLLAMLVAALVVCPVGAETLVVSAARMLVGETLENMGIPAHRRNEPFETVTRFTPFASLCRWPGRYACPQS